MIYISGMIGYGTLEQVKAKFQKIEDQLHALGVKVVNPMKMGFTQSWSSKQQLDVRLDVIRESVTGILLLRDWKNDINAKREFAEAGRLNCTRPNKIAIYFEDCGGIRDIANDIHDQRLTCLLQTESQSK